MKSLSGQFAIAAGTSNVAFRSSPATLILASSHKDRNLMVEGFEQHRVIVQMFIDSARSYAQLGTGALLLSVGFLEKIIGERRPLRPDIPLLGSWFFLLLSIGASALYQYCAVRYLDTFSATADDLSGLPAWLQSLIHRPGRAYGSMIVTFYLGVSFFTVGAAVRLWRESRSRLRAAASFS